MHPNRQHSPVASKIRPKGRARKTSTRQRSAQAKLNHTQVRADGGGFLSLVLERIGWEQLDGLNQRKHGAGRPTRVLTRGQLLVALVFHCTVGLAGSFAEHLFCLFDIEMAESTLSERRQTVPFEVFRELLRRLLRPVRTDSTQGFFRKWCLVAIDGVSFSLPNTPQVEASCKKGGNQTARAAFAKLQCAVLVELMWHNPLAARVAQAGESEWKLALGLLDSLPAQCLLLGDRLYGCAAFVVAAMERLKELQGHCLVRVAKPDEGAPQTAPLQRWQLSGGNQRPGCRRSPAVGRDGAGARDLRDG